MISGAILGYVLDTKKLVLSKEIIMADPYPALGSNYRPPIETYTTNRGLTLTAEEVVFLKEVSKQTYPPTLIEKINKL